MTNAHVRHRRAARVPKFLGKAVRLTPPESHGARPITPPPTNAAGGFAGVHVNNLVVRTQQLENWCWATVTQSVIRDRKGTELSQASIASDHSGRICGLQDVPSEGQADCDAPPCSAACNDRHALENLLKEHGVWRLSHWLGDVTNREQEIKAEIDQQRPVPIMLYVKTNEKLIHFAMIGGYSAGKFLLYFPVEDRQASVLDPVFVNWNQIKNTGFDCRGNIWHGANLYFVSL